MKKEEPVKKRDRFCRNMARRIRDSQWKFAEKVAKVGTLWTCWWNKDRHHDEANLPADVAVFCLISGSEILGWMNTHKDWWKIGEWSDERYAAPIRLTKKGLAALSNRELYDLEPVYGGMVEPGWQAIPYKRLMAEKVMT